MLFKLQDISLDFGEKELFNKLNFIFNEGDKIGLIGENGIGKSTLFNIILKKIEYSGTLLLENEHFGFLSQDEGFSEFTLENSRKTEIEKLLLQEEIISDTQRYDLLLNEYNSLVSGVDNQRKIELTKSFQFKSELYQREQKENLSGGESTKLKLIKLFSQDFDYLLLDEPSNHLDSSSRKVLIQQLKNYQSYIIISHDVELLNSSCNYIGEIKNNKLEIYTGNYNSYLEFKNKERENIIKTQTQHSNEKKRIESNIENLKTWSASKLDNQTKHLKEGQVISDLGIGKGSSASGIKDTAKKINKLKTKMESLDTPNLESEDEIKISYLDFVTPNKVVLDIKNLNKYFNNFTLNISEFQLLSKDKIAIQGNNGSGKSTFLKLILDELESDSGEIILGDVVRLGYLSQKNEHLNSENTILEEVRQSNSHLDEGEIRKYLGKFLFKKNDVFKVIKNLSGGEKMRLSLLKVILDGSNFLILDEPSNHLDIKSKNILASALKDFPGALLVVSHDDYFLDYFIDTKYVMVNGSLEKKL